MGAEMTAELQGGVAAALRLVREAHGLNRAELAKRARISAPYVSDIEAYRKPAGLIVLRRFAAALEVPLSEILRLAEELTAATPASDAGQRALDLAWAQTGGEGGGCTAG